MSLDDIFPGDWRPAALLAFGTVAATLLWGRDSRYEDWRHVDSALVGTIAAVAHTLGRLR